MERGQSTARLTRPCFIGLWMIAADPAHRAAARNALIGMLERGLLRLSAARMRAYASRVEYGRPSLTIRVPAQNLNTSRSAASLVRP